MAEPLFEPDPLDAPLGAEITGLDFDAHDADTLHAAIAEALDAHQVLVFRDATLSKDQQVALSRHFGTVQRHVLDQYRGADPEIFMISNLDENDRPIGEHPDPGATLWHADGSWARVPGYVTMLYALEIPRRGGDTLFADMYAAYAALDAETQARIATMQVVHDLNDSRRRSGARVQMTAEQRAAAPPVQQPMVRTHPRTGRKALYLGEHGCYALGMAETEGRAFVARLNAHATQPRFVYRHRWRARDLVMWDNRCTIHRATEFDTARERRVLRRTTVLEPEPV